jgi:hypothetical protein
VTLHHVRTKLCTGGERLKSPVPRHSRAANFVPPIAATWREPTTRADNLRAEPYSNSIGGWLAGGGPVGIMW